MQLPQDSRWKDETIESLSLAVRTYNCLRRANIISVSELAAKTRGELLAIRGMGVTSVRDVEKSLMDCGLRLGVRVAGIAAMQRSERNLSQNCLNNISSEAS